MTARDLFSQILASQGVAGLQTSLLHFEEGATPPRPEVEAEFEGENLAGYVHGGRCSRCGKPLRGGGLKAVGWPGLLCWNCWHQGGRRDGRADLSSDASGSRNSGYNLRR